MFQLVCGRSSQIELAFTLTDSVECASWHRKKQPLDIAATASSLVGHQTLLVRFQVLCGQLQLEQISHGIGTRIFGHDRNFSEVETRC
jgi:hypothetical protein